MKTNVRSEKEHTAEPAPEQSASSTSSSTAPEPRVGDNESVIAAYIASQPRHVLEKTASRYLANPSAHAAFVGFFESLSREQLDALAGLVYQHALRRTGPEDIDTEIDLLESAVMKFGAVHTLIKDELVRRIEEDKGAESNMMVQGLMDLSNELAAKMESSFRNLSTAFHAWDAVASAYSQPE